MSDQSVIAYAERIKNDEAFRLSLGAAPDGAARRAIAQEAGYDVSPDDVPAIRAALGLDEISDEDLERVAGGTGMGSSAETDSQWATIENSFMYTFAVAQCL
jgi:predicted ribosomally synthesized peptide with nif11-like leader